MRKKDTPKRCSRSMVLVKSVRWFSVVLGKKDQLVGPANDDDNNRPYNPMRLRDVEARYTTRGKGYSIHVKNPKTRTSFTQHINLSPRPGDLCPVRALETALSWHCARRHPPNTPLWLISETEEATPSWLRGLLMAAIGVDAGTSSFRAGGATQLATFSYSVVGVRSRFATTFERTVVDCYGAVM
ncbi:uncharacterized protein EV422DRAFT_302588 [Fimicolochytrium jonesii]|uniref:uncharacterized protein n=1 Tax=Fimicolochytrium jonesii TaxID=1396493 RepID=UPI0022FE7D6E|nr:uncharacterized protein EV422DRAFT_302588 [Fimicolochytrium jonesii]KAI8823987.1 hypothetical protein EV422DRAFT_302588 [Fimicolochytrium jonesii]